jgi:hypothetical protein
MIPLLTGYFIAENPKTLPTSLQSLEQSPCLCTHFSIWLLSPILAPLSASPFDLGVKLESCEKCTKVSFTSYYRWLSGIRVCWKPTFLCIIDSVLIIIQWNELDPMCEWHLNYDVCILYYHYNKRCSCMSSDFTRFWMNWSH